MDANSFKIEVDENGRVLGVPLNALPEKMRAHFAGKTLQIINGSYYILPNDWEDFLSTAERFSIPELKPGQYLSGRAALNLPATGGTGDWHRVQTFHRPRLRLSRAFICGPGCEVDTSSLLGQAGIYDATAMLDELGILHDSLSVRVASHARAVADLVLDAVLCDREPGHEWLDDWLPRESDQQPLWEMLEMASEKLNNEQNTLIEIWKVKSHEYSKAR